MIMQTSQDLERDMFQNSSGEARAQKVSPSMDSMAACPEHHLKASRVAMLHQLVVIFQHCQAMDCVNFLTGDESRFLLKYTHYGVWVRSGDEGPEAATTKIRPKSA
jgi:hypothetical protein